MATALLTSSSSLRWKSHMFLSVGSPPPAPLLMRNNLSIIKHTEFSKSLTESRVRCFMMNHVPISHNNIEETSLNHHPLEEKQIARVSSTKPYVNPYTFEGFCHVVFKAIKAVRNSTAPMAFLGFLWIMIVGMVAYKAELAELARSGDGMGSTQFSSSQPASACRCGSSSSHGFSSLRSGENIPEIYEFYVDVFVILPILACVCYRLLWSRPKSSLLKLQVGLINTGRSLQKDINRIAKTAHTSTLNGWIYMLKETTQSLLQHLEFCTSCHSFVIVGNYIKERNFIEFPFEEWRKIDVETFLHVNGVKRKNVPLQRTGGDGHIEITILVSARGAHELPTINSSGDIKRALEKLCSIPRNDIEGVEMLWTPQDEADTLSEQVLFEYYPILRPLTV